MSPSELEAPVDRTQHIQQQLEFFGSSHQESFVPQEVLLPLLAEGVSDAEGRAARTVRGNRMAACHVPGSSSALVLSCCGQMGERLELTVMRPTPKGRKDQGGSKSAWQAHTAASLSLQSEIQGVEVKVEMQAPLTPSPRTHNATAAGASGATPAHAAAGGRGVAAGGRVRVWVAARCRNRVNVLLLQHDDLRNWRSWSMEWRGSCLCHTTPLAMAWSPVLPELATVLSDGTVQVTPVAALSVVSTSDLAAPLPLPCMHVVAGGVLDRDLGLGVEMKGEGVGHRAVSRRKGGDLAELGVRAACVYGMHPRTLVVGVGRSLWTCRIGRATPAPQHATPAAAPAPAAPPSNAYAPPTLVHTLPLGEVFTALAAPSSRFTPAATVPPGSPSLGPHNPAVAAYGVHSHPHQLLLPYLAATTSVRVLLFDCRRLHAPVMCWAQGTAQLPTLLQVVAMGGRAGAGRAAAVEGAAGGGGGGGVGGAIGGGGGGGVLSEGGDEASRGQPAGGTQGVPASQPAVGSQVAWIGTQASQADAWGAGAAHAPRQGHGGRVGAGGGAPVGPQAAALIVWGCEGLGQVRCVEVVVSGAPLGLGVPEAREAEAGQGRGQDGSEVHGSAGAGPGVGLTLLHHHHHHHHHLHHLHHPLSDGPDSLGAHQGRAGAAPSQPPEGPTVAQPPAWWPACLAPIQSRGLPRELCPARTLLQLPRRRALEASRALLHSAGVTTHRGGGWGGGSTAPAVALSEARYWGRHGDAHTRRAALMRAHVRASRDAADLHGFSALILPPGQGPELPNTPAWSLLLLRLSSDGDICFQPFHHAHTDKSMLRPAPLHLPTPTCLAASHSPATTTTTTTTSQPAALENATGTRGGDDEEQLGSKQGPAQGDSCAAPLVQLSGCDEAAADYGDVRFRLVARYPDAKSAQSLILGGRKRLNDLAHLDHNGRPGIGSKSAESRMVWLQHHHARMARLLLAGAPEPSLSHQRALAHSKHDQLWHHEPQPTPVMHSQRLVKTHLQRALLAGRPKRATKAGTSAPSSDGDLLSQLVSQCPVALTLGDIAGRLQRTKRPPPAAPTRGQQPTKLQQFRLSRRKTTMPEVKADAGQPDLVTDVVDPSIPFPVVRGTLGVNAWLESLKAMVPRVVPVLATEKHDTLPEPAGLAPAVSDQGTGVGPGSHAAGLSGGEDAAGAVGVDNVRAAYDACSPSDYAQLVSEIEGLARQADDAPGPSTGLAPSSSVLHGRCGLMLRTWNGDAGGAQARSRHDSAQQAAPMPFLDTFPAAAAELQAHMEIVLRPEHVLTFPTQVDINAAGAGVTDGGAQPAPKRARTASGTAGKASRADSSQRLPGTVELGKEPGSVFKDLLAAWPDEHPVLGSTQDSRFFAPVPVTPAKGGRVGAAGAVKAPHTAARTGGTGRKTVKFNDSPMDLLALGFESQQSVQQVVHHHHGPAPLQLHSILRKTGRPGSSQPQAARTASTDYDPDTRPAPASAPRPLAPPLGTPYGTQQRPASQPQQAPMSAPQQRKRKAPPARPFSEGF